MDGLFFFFLPTTPFHSQRSQTRLPTDLGAKLVFVFFGFPLAASRTLTFFPDLDRPRSRLLFFLARHVDGNGPHLFGANALWIDRGLKHPPLPGQPSTDRYALSGKNEKKRKKERKETSCSSEPRLSLARHANVGSRLYLPLTHGLFPAVTKTDIENHFKKHGTGEILEIKLMNGFGFIEYKDAMDARDVVPAFRTLS